MFNSQTNSALKHDKQSLFSVLCAITIAYVIVFPHEAFGQETWRRVYGAYYEEQCVAVRAVSNDQFIMAGTTGSFGAGGSDIYLMSVDGSGNHQWSVTIGGSGIEQARDLQLLPDGGFVVIGTSNLGDVEGYNGLILKTDSLGAVLWQKTFGGADWDFFNQVKVLSDGGFIIAGQTFSTEIPGGKSWLIKLNSEGEVIWEEIMEDTGTSSAFSVSEIQNEGYIVAGSLNDDGFAAKYTESGDLIWLESYGGDSLDFARDVIVCQDGNFSIVGTTESYSPHTEAWHLKITAEGEEMWYRNWGQIDDQESWRHAELQDGSFITIGYTKTSGGGEKDLFLLKSDSEGLFVFGKTFGGHLDEEGYGIDVLENGFICGGYTKTFGYGSSDYYLIRTDLSGLTEGEENLTFFDPLSISSSIESSSSLVIYPNPSRGLFYVESGTDRLEKIRIVNQVGQLQVEKDAGNNSFRVDLPAGQYLIEGYFGSGEVKHSWLQIIH